MIIKFSRKYIIEANSSMTPNMTRTSKRLWFSAALLALVVSSSAVRADEFSDVTKLVQTGQYVDAINKVDTYLAQHPKDAHMRFVKGLILAEQNKTAEAIVIFTRLTDDFPDLPEPYNNLAVLYASLNQYDKARASLEMAIRTNPSYSTAHENLGDIYAKMASQAYDKALQLDSGNAGAKLKLSLIHTLFTNGGSSVAASTNAASAKSPAAPATPAAKLATTVAGNTAAAKVPAPPKPEQVAKLEPVKPVPVKVEPVKPAMSNGQEEVLKLLDGWANAWSNKNTNSYLTYYASDFQTPKGESHKAWADERRLRIEGKGHISVKIDGPKVSIEGNTATVRFRQIYNSDQLNADSRKTLVFSHQDGKWLITQERSGG